MTTEDKIINYLTKLYCLSRLKSSDKQWSKGQYVRDVDRRRAYTTWHKADIIRQNQLLRSYTRFHNKIDTMFHKEPMMSHFL